MPSDHSQSGNRVRELRVDKGWTPEDMSVAIFAKFGVKYATSARTISRVEEGHRPTVRKQYAIAVILGEQPSRLWSSSSRTTRASA